MATGLSSFSTFTRIAGSFGSIDEVYWHAHNMYPAVFDEKMHEASKRAEIVWDNCHRGRRGGKWLDVGKFSVR